jgi:hypothetical protein
MKTLLSIFILIASSTQAQKVDIVHSGTKTSLRGLSVVSDRVIWVSGSNGTVGRSVDGGTTWQWMTVKGFEKTDFRDIEAFDDKTAVILGISEPAYILKTFNGGENWKVVYSDSTAGVFLDAMEFWDDSHAMAVGDPIDGKLYVVQTVDNGNRWKRFPTDKLDKPEKGEAFYASSGTNIRALNRDQAVMVTGGTKSRILLGGKLYDLPIMQGTESTGANSIAVWYKGNKTQRLVVVGGDFKNDTISTNNCFYSTDLGRVWKAPVNGPNGYRSCVEFINKSTLVTCGLTGVDISNDGAENWKNISSEAFHVCRRAKNGKAVFLAGPGGKIGIVRQ